jgi:hypothetical protein
MLPIIQWLISLERAPPPTRRLLTIERTQGWTMLAFYPLQHLSYFRKHDLIPTALPLPPGLPSSGKLRRVTINPAAISLWSSRLWATYIVLQLAHLREDRSLLIKKRRALSRLSSVEKERAELARRWDTWYNELAVNLSFLPMTIHWYDSLSPFHSPRAHLILLHTIQFRSLERGLFKNDVNPSFLISCCVHTDENKTFFSGLDFVLWSCCCDSIVPQRLEGHGSPTFHTSGRAASSSGNRGRRHTQNFR